MGWLLDLANIYLLNYVMPLENLKLDNILGFYVRFNKNKYFGVYFVSYLLTNNYNKLYYNTF